MFEWIMLEPFNGIDVRRLRYVSMTPDLLLRLCAGRYNVKRNPIPRDAEFAGVAWDEDRRCLRLYIRHPSFASVLEDEDIPECPAPEIERVAKALAALDGKEETIPASAPESDASAPRD